MNHSTNGHRNNRHNHTAHKNGANAENDGTAALSEPLRFVPIDGADAHSAAETGIVVSGSDLLALEDRKTVDEFGPSFFEAYESTEVVTGEPEQYAKIEEAVHALLDAFNVN